MNKEIRGAFEQLLEATAIGDALDYDYAVFQRTGEREITLTARIYRPGMETDNDIASFREFVESIGWTFVIADNVSNISIVARINKRKNTVRDGTYIPFPCY